VLAGIPINDRTSTLFINALSSSAADRSPTTIVRYQFLDMRLIARKGILYAARR